MVLPFGSEVPRKISQDHREILRRQRSAFVEHRVEDLGPPLGARSLPPDPLQIVTLCADVQDDFLPRAVGQRSVVLDQIRDQHRHVVLLDLGALLDLRRHHFHPASLVQRLSVDRPAIVTRRAARVLDLLSSFGFWSLLARSRLAGGGQRQRYCRDDRSEPRPETKM